MKNKEYLVGLDIVFVDSDKNHRVNVPFYMISEYIKYTLVNKKIKYIKRLDNDQIFYNQLELF